jgi:hypothetical protein
MAAVIAAAGRPRRTVDPSPTWSEGHGKLCGRKAPSTELIEVLPLNLWSLPTAVMVERAHKKLQAKTTGKPERSEGDAW